MELIAFPVMIMGFVLGPVVQLIPVRWLVMSINTIAFSVFIFILGLIGLFTKVFGSGYSDSYDTDTTGTTGIMMLVFALAVGFGVSYGVDKVSNKWVRGSYLCDALRGGNDRWMVHL